MNRHFKGLVYQAIFVGLVLAGWQYDIDGARNVAATLIWTIGVLVGLVGICSGRVHQELAGDRPAWPPLRLIRSGLNTAVLITLLWHGWIATGVAFGFYMLGGAVAHNEAQKLRTKGAAA